MPGAVHDNKERTMGYYIYLFNGKTGICYHRNFVEASNDEIIAHYLGIEDLSNSTLYDIAFPALEKEKK
ncbi:MAG: hypothetical protein WCE21_05365, partial [Candidatus Babeliales bacterium]